MMPDELTPPNPPVVESGEDVAQLRKSIEALERKNHQLKAEKDAAKIAAAEADELRRFKQQREAADLEAEGKYQEARQVLQQQYDTDTAALKARIAELEAEVRDLRVITPAASVLAQIVHDPTDVFATGRLKAEQIEQGADGPVVVNGLQRQPLADWARENLPQHYLKAPAPRGTGAPAGRSNAAPITAADPDLAFFIPTNKGGRYNLTEQQRIFNQDRARYLQLIAAANAAS